MSAVHCRCYYVLLKNPLLFHRRFYLFIFIQLLEFAVFDVGTDECNSSYSELFGQKVVLMEKYLCGEVQCIMVIPPAYRTFDGFSIYTLVMLSTKAAFEKSTALSFNNLEYSKEDINEFVKIFFRRFWIS